MMQKASLIIGDIIKSNIEKYGYSQKEISILSGINSINLSNIINGKEEISYNNSKKLSSVFDNMKDSPSFLFDTFNKMLDLEQENKDEKEIIKLIAQDSLYDNLTLINKLKDIYPSGSIQKFGEFLSHSSVSYSKYLNKPLAKLWVLLMYKKHNNITSPNNFKKSSGAIVFNKVLKIFFSNDTIDHKIKSIQKELFNRGIILKNGPFIKGSSIKGVSFKKKTTRFIFLSDMFKRQYRWLISLIHELIHFYQNCENEDEVENEAINKIKSYINKHKIIDKDFETFFKLKDLYKRKTKEEYFDELHSRTKKSISFGNSNDLTSIIF